MLHGFGHGGPQACAFRCLGLKCQKLALAFLPTAMHCIEHAHRLHHVRIAQRRLGKLLRTHGTAIGFTQRFARCALIHPGHNNLRNAAQYGGIAQHRTDRKDQSQGNQGHRRFQDCHQSRIGQKLAHRLQVVEYLHRAAHLPLQETLKHGVVHALGKCLVNLHASCSHQ